MYLKHVFLTLKDKVLQNILFTCSYYVKSSFTDGLRDCMDPDCCSSSECTDNMYCRASPDPAEILLRKQPPSTTASFYEKMRFLVEENSVQMETSKNAFNER